MYNFSQDLFASGDAPFSFKVSSCSDASELTSCIEFGGGRVDETAGPCTITLLDPGCGASVVTPDQDVFSSLFIWKCSSHNSLLSLKDFRLNSDSCFTNEFDPNEILFGKLSWEDAKALFTKEPMIKALNRFRSPIGSVILNGLVPIVCIEMTDDTLQSRKSEDYTKCDAASSDSSDTVFGSCIRKKNVNQFSDDETSGYSLCPSPKRDWLLGKENLNGQTPPGNRSPKDASIIICRNPVGNNSVESSLQIEIDNQSTVQQCGCPNRQEKTVLWDCKDSGMQTEQVTILPLPAGSEYPMTFNAALEMIKDGIVLKLKES